MLRHEIESAADLRRFDALQRLARLLLARTGSEFVTSRLADELGLDRCTVDSYSAWIETAFLVHRLPAWSRKISSKLVRRPKLHACDTGLATAILGNNREALERSNDPSLGVLLESFVIAELAEQLTWASCTARIYARDRDGLEVDSIVETADGRVLAIEVKASSLARRDDARPIATLRDRLDRVGDDFVVASCSTPATDASRLATASSGCRSLTSGHDVPRRQCVSVAITAAQMGDQPDIT